MEFGAVNFRITENLDQSSKNILVDTIEIGDPLTFPTSITLLFVPPSGVMEVYGEADEFLSGDMHVIFHRDNYDDLDFDFGVESGADRIYIEKYEEI